jgi:hypothetical protein
MKKCRKCKIEKPLSFFYKIDKYYQSNCKKCLYDYVKEKGIKNRVPTEEKTIQNGEIFIKFLENYLVSNLGRVYREEHIYKNKFYRGKFLNTNILNTGYMKVSIMQKQYLIHRLIAKLFIPNPFNKKQVNHIDSNRLNNNIDNLEWVSHQENVEHCTQKNRMSKKLTKNDVLNIKNSNETVKNLAKKYNVSDTNIRYIINGKIWKHICN